MTKPIDTNDIRERLRDYNVSDAELFALCDEIDRLRGVQTPPQGKTVRVKVAVGVEPTGKWNAFGWSHGTDAEKMELAVEPLDPGEARFWLTATLPVPQEVEVVAEVREVNDTLEGHE